MAPAVSSFGSLLLLLPTLTISTYAALAPSRTMPACPKVSPCPLEIYDEGFALILSICAHSISTG